jgi:ribonuclease Z
MLNFKTLSKKEKYITDSSQLRNMKIIFLGTSSMVPTKERNHTSIFISYKSEGILIDCGENTQRQLIKKGISLSKITKVFITHWHSDHVLGLPGLIQSLGSYKENAKIEIYGPKGTKKNIKAALKIFSNKSQKKVTVKSFDISKGTIFENKDFFIETLPLDHGCPAQGYSLIEKDKRKMKMNQIKKLGIPEGPLLGKLQQGEKIIFKHKKILPKDVSRVIKGKKVSFVLDTKLTQNCYTLAKNSDLLICESTLDSSLTEKAESRFHLTSKQAALIAKNSNVKKLVLTHFSPRYKDVKILEKDAKKIFKNVVASKDFMLLKI